MTGLAIVMATETTPFLTFMQLARTFLNYGHAFFVQTAHTAMANGQSKIAERLARWLLMAHDRVDGDELALTHELLATMLGVQRPGVTVALNLFEDHGFIQTNLE